MRCKEIIRFIPLCLIHRRVRAFDQSFRIRAIFREDRDSDTGHDASIKVEVACADKKRLLNFLYDLFRNQRNIGFFPDLGYQDDKFVATVPAGSVATTNAFPEPIETAQKIGQVVG